MNISDTKATLSFSDGSPAIDMPIYKGTVGPDVIDIRKLYAQTGKFTYDPGFMSTAACNSSITYIDGDKGELLYRGYPIEQLAVNCDFLETCYLLLNGELPNAAQKPEVQRHRDQAHDGARADAILLPRLPPRRAPDVGAGRHRRRAGLVLPRLARHQRPASPRSVGDPPDRQDADPGRDGVQVLDRPAVRVPAQRPVVQRQLHAHDVRQSVRRVRGQRRAGARAGPHPDPARGPRAERIDLDRPPGRFVGRQPVRLYRSRYRLPVGPCPRRRQRSGTEHAQGNRHASRTSLPSSRRSRTRTPASS